MYPGDFERIFRKIADIFTLDLIAEEKNLDQNYPKRNPNTPIWDTLDSFESLEGFIDIGKNRYVSCKNSFKRPLRILFFFLIAELEGRIYRILEWSGKKSYELNEKNLNNFIIELIDSDLINLQNIYSSRAEFKEDLKAVSSFRNIIVHINKKIKDSVDNKTILKRRNQINKLLLSTQQILDQMELSYRKNVSNIPDEQIELMKSSIGNLEESIKKIYFKRSIRPLSGEDSILIRTIGAGYLSPINFQEQYFDKKRGKFTRTELSELNLVLEEYDNDPTERNKLKLLLELGDIIEQKLIVNIFYKEDKLFDYVNNTFNSIINYFENEFKKRNLSIEFVYELTRYKYGIRAWLRENGFGGKDKKLEYDLCMGRLIELLKNS